MQHDRVTMAAISEDRIQRIEARVTAVEQAQNDNTQSLRFIVTTVAQMKAVQDDHGQTLAEHGRALDDHTRILGEHSKFLGEHSKVLGDHGKRLDRIEGEVKGLRTDLHGLRKDLPTMMADVMREVLKENR
jgi:chromosome segregation ATPase